MMELSTFVQGAAMQTTLGTWALEPTFSNAVPGPRARRIDAGTTRTEVPARCGSLMASRVCALTGA